MNDTDEATEDKIRQLAYSLWEQAGRPDGRDTDFWREAREIVSNEQKPEPSHGHKYDEAISESFPASDPVNHM